MSHISHVSFDHKYGPVAEYTYPDLPVLNPSSPIDHTRRKISLPVEWASLAFFALPDGVHSSEQDFVWFHLPPIPEEGVERTTFAISCVRQLAASKLQNKTQDVTRNTIQKGIVVLMKQPILNLVRPKLDIVTQSLFDQLDFSQVDVLKDLYESLNNLSKGKRLPDSAYCLSASVRQLVKQFRLKTLSLFKLLMLEKRVIFFGNRPERLCALQYALISLFPDLLRNLTDVGSPSLDFQFSDNDDSLTPQEKERWTRMEKFGLPLHIFGQDAFFQPYTPLQQLEILLDDTTKTYVIGATNQIFLTQKAAKIDVIVHVDSGNLEFLNGNIESQVNLTAADKKFMDEICKLVDNTWTQDEEDEAYALGLETVPFEGSDQDIRQRFESYLFGLLSSTRKLQASNDKSIQRNLVGDYNLSFVASWYQTRNYEYWDEQTSDQDLDDYQHPYKGTTTLGEIGSAISSRFKALRVKDQAQSVAQAVTETVQQGKANLETFLQELDGDEIPDIPVLDKAKETTSRWFSSVANLVKKPSE